MFEWLQRRGPSSPEEIASALTLQPESVRQGIADLAKVGLIEQRGSLVRAFGRGLFLPPPSADAEISDATRALGVVMLSAVAGAPQRWLDEVEPGLDPRWAAAAGLFNAGVVLTRQELEVVQQDLERSLEPYLKRAAVDRPADGVKVRVLAWFLPEAGADGEQGE